MFSWVPLGTLGKNVQVRPTGSCNRLLCLKIGFLKLISSKNRLLSFLNRIRRKHYSSPRTTTTGMHILSVWMQKPLYFIYIVILTHLAREPSAACVYSVSRFSETTYSHSTEIISPFQHKFFEIMWIFQCFSKPSVPLERITKASAKRVWWESRRIPASGRRIGFIACFGDAMLYPLFGWSRENA